MKNRLLVIGVLLIIASMLSACSASILGMIPVRSETTYGQENGAPVEEVVILPTEDTAVVEIADENEPFKNEDDVYSGDLSFAAAEYLEKSAGLVIFHPVDWMISPLEQIGERGAQAALLSPGSTLEQIAEGGARIIITTYKWDPRNDLTAYVDQRRLAWEASGFEILSEEMFTLADGRVFELFRVKVIDGSEVLFSFTTFGEDYVQIVGDGDLVLCEEIIRAIRTIE